MIVVFVLWFCLVLWLMFVDCFHKDILVAVFHGVLDSLRGCLLIFTLDRQIQQQRERLQHWEKLQHREKLHLK